MRLKELFVSVRKIKQMKHLKTPLGFRDLQMLRLKELCHVQTFLIAHTSHKPCCSLNV